MSENREELIREQRTIEATKKNLMGPSGKFGQILKAFGVPILKQGSSLYHQSSLDDYYDDFTTTVYETTASNQNGPVVYRDEIKEIEDEYIEETGLLFDGLNRGIHMEIIYWHEDSSLKVSFKGYVVYKEVAGQLEAYTPTDAWENIIERLVKSAEEKLKEMKIQEKVSLQRMFQEEKAGFLEKLRIKWGI